MSTIEIKIDKKGQLPGSVGWLAERARTISLGTSKDGRAGAWLLDAEGKCLELLAIDTQDSGIIRLTKDAQYFEVEIPPDRNYTDAAWVILDQLTDIAVEQLQESATLSSAYSVEVKPKNEVLAALMQAASDEPAARAALVDYINNCGE